MSIQISKGSAKFRYGISSPAQLDQVLEEIGQHKGLAFIGRSNVGKSSLINALFGSKTAKTSKTPGRTREINIFEFYLEDKGKLIEDRSYYLYDLPGYGHAEVSKQMSKNWNLLMDIFFGNMGRQTLMINIQDARHPAQSVDLQFAQYMRQFDFYSILALNKIDKLKTQKEKSEFQKLIPQISKDFLFARYLYQISAETRQGLEPLESNIVRFLLSQ